LGVSFDFLAGGASAQSGRWDWMDRARTSTLWSTAFLPDRLSRYRGRAVRRLLGHQTPKNVFPPAHGTGERSRESRKRLLRFSVAREGPPRESLSRFRHILAIPFLRGIRGRALGPFWAARGTIRLNQGGVAVRGALAAGPSSTRKRGRRQRSSAGERRATRWTGPGQAGRATGDTWVTFPRRHPFKVGTRSAAGSY